MTPMAVPRAKSAETMGSIAAKNDPKTSISTTKARSTPTPVPLKDCGFVNSANWPETAT